MTALFKNYICIGTVYFDFSKTWNLTAHDFFIQNVHLLELTESVLQRLEIDSLLGFKKVAAHQEITRAVFLVIHLRPVLSLTWLNMLIHNPNKTEEIFTGKFEKRLKKKVVLLTGNYPALRMLINLEI